MSSVFDSTYLCEQLIDMKNVESRTRTVPTYEHLEEYIRIAEKKVKPDILKQNKGQVFEKLFC
jgi:hypothetical protein